MQISGPTKGLLVTFLIIVYVEAGIFSLDSLEHSAPPPHLLQLIKAWLLCICILFGALFNLPPWASSHVGSGLLAMDSVPFPSFPPSLPVCLSLRLSHSLAHSLNRSLTHTAPLWPQEITTPTKEAHGLLYLLTLTSNKNAIAQALAPVKQQGQKLTAP